MSGGGIILALLIVCGFVALWHELNNAKSKQKPGAKPKKKATATGGNQGKTLLIKADWTNDPEQFEATGSADFQQVMSEAARLAKSKGHPVKFGFNRRPGEKQYRVFPGGHFELTN